MGPSCKAGGLSVEIAHQIVPALQERLEVPCRAAPGRQRASRMQHSLLVNHQW